MDEVWQDFRETERDELTLHLDPQETYVLSVLVAGLRVPEHPVVDEVRDRVWEKLQRALVDKGAYPARAQTSARPRKGLWSRVWQRRSSTRRLFG